MCTNNVGIKNKTVYVKRFYRSQQYNKKTPALRMLPSIQKVPNPLTGKDSTLNAYCIYKLCLSVIIYTSLSLFFFSLSSRVPEIDTKEMHAEEM